MERLIVWKHTRVAADIQMLSFGSAVIPTRNRAITQLSSEPFRVHSQCPFSPILPDERSIKKPTDLVKSFRWPAYEVFPTTKWNYGLVVDLKDPSRSFEVMEKVGPLAKQPFDLESAPIELTAEGRLIPQWKLESNGMTGSLQESPAKSNEPAEKITLVPMGCARLRISFFPRLGEGPGTNRWK